MRPLIVKEMCALIASQEQKMKVIRQKQKYMAEERKKRSWNYVLFPFSLKLQNSLFCGRDCVKMTVYPCSCYCAQTNTCILFIHSLHTFSPAFPFCSQIGPEDLSESSFWTKAKEDRSSCLAYCFCHQLSFCFQRLPSLLTAQSRLVRHTCQITVPKRGRIFC